MPGAGMPYQMASTAIVANGSSGLGSRAMPGVVPQAQPLTPSLALGQPGTDSGIGLIGMAPRSNSSSQVRPWLQKAGRQQHQAAVVQVFESETSLLLLDTENKSRDATEGLLICSLLSCVLQVLMEP